MSGTHEPFGKTGSVGGVTRRLRRVIEAEDGYSQATGGHEATLSGCCLRSRPDDFASAHPGEAEVETCVRPCCRLGIFLRPPAAPLQLDVAEPLGRHMGDLTAWQGRAQGPLRRTWSTGSWINKNLKGLSMNRRRSIRNSLTLIAGQGVAQVASAVTFLILARGLGVEQFGALASLYGFSLFLSILVEFGASSYATRELSQSQRQWHFPGQFRSRQAITGIVLSLSIILMFVVPAGRDVLLAIAISFLTALTRLMSAPVRAALHMGRLAAISIVDKTAALLSVLALDSFGYLSTTSFFVITLFTGIIAGVALRASWSPRYSAAVKRTKSKRFSNPFAGHRHLGLSSMALGLQSLDAAAVAATAGPFAAGVYAAVGKWTQPLGFVTQAVTLSAYPEMAGARRHRDAFDSLRVNLVLLTLTAVPLVGIFIFADTLTLYLLGPEYGASSSILRVLIGAVLFGIVNSPMSALLQARSEEVFVSRIFMLAIPTQIGLMCVLASAGGALLGSFAVLLVQGAMAILLTLRVRRLLRSERLVLESDLTLAATGLIRESK